MLFLMDLPAPIHGMSTINKAILDYVNDTGDYSPKIINTVPSYAARYFGGPLWGPVKFIHTVGCLFRLMVALVTLNNRVVYRPINGGVGQIFDLCYMAIIRMSGARIIIHHHSFNYLHTFSKIFKVLNKLAGEKSRHVVLGLKMTEKLHELYGIPPSRIIELSNVAFFGESSPRNEINDQHLVIGHLANLCTDKGVDDFITICEELQRKEVKFVAKIAGPFADSESLKLVTDATQKNNNIKYLGPIYGAEKRHYFASLDAFVFPSKYRNEAEPLVLYEAAQHGVLNIGTKRGCMESVIESLGGYSIEESSSIALDIATFIENAYTNGEFSTKMRGVRLSKYEHCKAKANSSLNQLIHLMVG